MSAVLMTRSGVPICHAVSSFHTRAGGASAGLPRGAPLSAHLPIMAISASLSDGSFLKCWMPISFSTYHGGITPAFGPTLVRALIERAHGRTCS